MYNSAGGIGKEYRGPQLCEKKDFSPDGYTAPIFNFIPDTCAQSLMRDHLVVIDDNDDRNRFKISLNTNASHQCVRDVERLKFVIIFVLRRESDINLAKINGK